MTRRDAQIVKWSRLYRLLATRSEYTSRDLEERVTRTSPRLAPNLSGVDAEAIEDMTELGRMCGGAVGRLSRGYNAAIVDVLGWLAPDRLAAIALALPEKRRRAVLRGDPVWARAFAAIDLDAIAEVEQLIADFDALDRSLDDLWRAVGLDPVRFEEDARRYLLGLPSDLSPEVRQLLDNPRALSDAAR